MKECNDKHDDNVGVKVQEMEFDGTNSIDKTKMKKEDSFCDRFLSDISMISVLVFFALFFKGFTLTMVIPIIPKALHLEDDAFLTSIIVIIKSVSSIITSLVLKPYFDPYLLPLFAFGFLSLALAQLFFILSSNYYVWLGGRLLVGFSTAFLTPCGLAIIQKVYKDKTQRARIMGYVGTGSSLSTVTAPALAGALFDVHHTLPFVFVALIGLFAFPFSIHLMRTLTFDNNDHNEEQQQAKEEEEEEITSSSSLTTPTTPTTPTTTSNGTEAVVVSSSRSQSSLSSLESGEGPSSSTAPSSTTTTTTEPTATTATKTTSTSSVIHDPTIMDMLRDRETSMLYLSSFFMSAFVVFTEASVGVFLEGPAFEFTASQTGLMYWGGLAMFIGSVTSGHLCSAIGASNVAALGLFTQGLFIALGPKHILAVTIISVSVAGMGFALAMNSVNQALSLVSDERFAGTANLFNMDSVFSQLGVIVGPLIGGYLSDTIGFEYSSLAFGGIEVLAAAMFAILIFLQYIPRR